MNTRRRNLLAVGCAVALLAAGPVGCGDEGIPDTSYRAPSDTGTEVADRDAGRVPDTGTDEDADTGDTVSAGDTGEVSDDGADTSISDTDTDTAGCDRDEDGYLAESCGGGDCDDDNSRVHPGAAEQCDFIDADCDEVLNNDLSCTFFAHTADDLYEIDPFRGTSVHITSVPRLLDFDTHPDGTLWGVTSSTLYRFDEVERSWRSVGTSLGLVGVNGFAIDNAGNAYATGGNILYGVDLDAGSADRIGSMGGGYISSGDCVVDKDNVLYMTSKENVAGDTLVRLDAATGRATEVGAIGFDSVFGLTAAWGFLFGLTDAGEVLEIDPGTGAGSLVARFDGRVWYGAASTAGR